MLFESGLRSGIEVQQISMTAIEVRFLTARAALSAATWII